VVILLSPATVGRVELEVPKKVARLLEMWSGSDDLMDHVLHADDTVSAEFLLDDFIVGESYTAAINLAKPTLVDQLAHRLEVGVSPSDVRLSNSQHVDRCLVQLNEDSIVDLAQTEQLENLARFGVKAIDTSDSDDEGDLGLVGHVEVVALAGLAGTTQLVQLLGAVLLGVLLSALEDILALIGALLVSK